MRHSVIYTKPLQQIDPKTKQRTIIPADTAAELSSEQLAAVRHAVRVVKSRPAGSNARVSVTAAPSADMPKPEADE